ncbi:MAG: dipeptidase [Bacteroidetes bacterium]|jgi:acetylornithine deacetylase/succinyl-diaminopimelate desuccinylase-like protein|nr:dipeptidase [Bacteroidota bacterium]MBT3751580.1 dipeptidase [Bacteroidota bacterium]MBT5425388.1 dipeptidase [Bacteroidota bacterium]MBT7465664.1 dipeptidase [Bacteroidota bacterium]
MHINDYIEQNKDRFLEELFELIRIPSISSLSKHKPDMKRAADYWKEALLAAGADHASVYQTDGNPVAYGEKIIDPELPTVLVYAHMDVMPVDPLDLWETDPFEPVIKDGVIFARGADDDKGQGFMHAKAFEYLVKTNQLPCNVKFMIEGEEEIGSPNLGKFCKENKDMLKADVILVSDTGMIAQDIPSITTGLRGLTYLQVELTGPNRDLHSGLFGGAVDNPVNALCTMLASLQDEDKRITIPGFYDDVIEVSAEEREFMAKAPFNLKEYENAIDVNTVAGEKGFSTNERTGIRPSFDICGIWGGYTGEGAKTVLPSKAYAKISTRLVPDQNHEKIAELVKKHLESISPDSIKIDVVPLHGGPAYVSPTTITAYLAADKAYTEAFGKRPVPVRSGGSIPIISTFEEVLGIKSILMGFGLESDAIHSPNENYPVWNFLKGIETITYFYKHYAEMMK